MSDSRPAPLLPPLYGRLEPLNQETHKELRLRDAGLSFAGELSAVPLAAEEFLPASRHMAIVFGSEAPHMPVAITGLRAGSNLFIQGSQWRAGAYVPSYLRRYPFFLVRVREGSDEMALCLDPTAPQVSREAGEPLFGEDGQPTPLARNAFEFTRAVEAAFVRTRELSEELARLNLLAPAAVEFQKDGAPFRIDGFHAVQREALAKLSGDDLARLRDKGWLDAIYAHLFSLGGIPELAQKAA